MHIKSETRRLLKRRSTKVVVVLLTAVLAIQSVNLPAIAMALPDGDNLATVDDTQATTPATTTGEEGTTTETEGNTPEVQNTDTTVTDPATTSAGQQAAATTLADSTGSTATDPAAATTPDTQAAPAEDTTATISLNLNESSLTYSEQTYQSDATTLEAPAQQELKFTVAPVDGYQIDTVKQVVNGVETELTADESGIFTIAADAVADGLAINVATSEVPPAEEAPAEEPATEGDENAAADENAVENGDESATDDAANDEGATEGDEPADEATAGDEVTNKVASLMSTASNGIALMAAGSTRDVSGSGSETDPFVLEPGGSKDLVLDYSPDAEWRISETGNDNDWHGGRDSVSLGEATLSDIDNGSKGTWVSFVVYVGARDASATFILSSGAVSGDRYYVSYGNTTYVFEVAQGTEYVIDYAVDGVQNGSGTFWGDSLKFPSCSVSNGEMSFMGWKVEGDNSGTVYMPGQTYTPSQETGSITIVAQWGMDLAISPTNMNLEIGETGQLAVSPSSWAADVDWSSSNSSIASVDSSGKVTAKKLALSLLPLLQTTRDQTVGR